MSEAVEKETVFIYVIFLTLSNFSEFHYKDIASPYSAPQTTNVNSR